MPNVLPVWGQIRPLLETDLLTSDSFRTFLLGMLDKRLVEFTKHAEYAEEEISLA